MNFDFERFCLTELREDIEKIDVALDAYYDFEEFKPRIRALFEKTYERGREDERNNSSSSNEAK